MNDIDDDDDDGNSVAIHEILWARTSFNVGMGFALYQLDTPTLTYLKGWVGIVWHTDIQRMEDETAGRCRPLH